MTAVREGGGPDPAGARLPHRPAVVVLIVLLLLGIATTAWYVRGREQPLAGTRAGVGGKPIDRGPDGPLPVGRLPGISVQLDMYRRFPSIAELGFLRHRESAAYSDGGAGLTRVSLDKLDGAVVAVVEVQVADGGAARATVRKLVALQHSYGLAPAPAPPAVSASANREPLRDGAWLMRAHYVHGDVVVRIDARGRNRSSVRAGFDGALAAQLRVLDAHG